MAKNIRKLNQKIKKLTSNSASDNEYNNNDYNKFYKYGYHNIIWGQKLEGKQSRKCSGINSQIKRVTGLPKFA
jgi:hypothetical protein